jgi:hypothetical protein
MFVWNARGARGAPYEALVEEAFDHAETYASGGNFERALEALAEAEDLAGGLPPLYIERRKRWISELEPLAVVARR